MLMRNSQTLFGISEKIVLIHFSTISSIFHKSYHFFLIAFVICLDYIYLQLFIT